MKSTHHCPSCHQALTIEEHPSKSTKNPKPYLVIFCENPRCESDSARNDGGSGDTEGHAFLSLCNAVDNETEAQCDPMAERERVAMGKAEHDNDLAKASGA